MKEPAYCPGFNPRSPSVSSVVVVLLRHVSGNSAVRTSSESSRRPCCQRRCASRWDSGSRDFRSRRSRRRSCCCFLPSSVLPGVAAGVGVRLLLLLLLESSSGRLMTANLSKSKVWMASWDTAPRSEQSPCRPRYPAVRSRTTRQYARIERQLPESPTCLASALARSSAMNASMKHRIASTAVAAASFSSALGGEPFSDFVAARV